MSLFIGKKVGSELKLCLFTQEKKSVFNGKKVCFYYI